MARTLQTNVREYDSGNLIGMASIFSCGAVWKRELCGIQIHRLSTDWVLSHSKTVSYFLLRQASPSPPEET